MEVLPEYKNEVDNICKQIAELYKKQLTDDNAVASGELLKSVDNYTYNFNGNDFELWFNLNHYWKYAPEGKFNNGKPSKYPPPVTDIRKWIEDKHLDLNEYAVARKIQKHGWKNQPRQNYQQFRDSFDFAMLERQLEDVLFKSFEQKTLREITNEFLKGL